MESQKISREVSLGEVFFISLEGNPGTGYIWSPESGYEKFSFPHEEFVPGSHYIDTNGVQTFAVIPKESGHHLLEFHYKRPFEEKEPIHVVEVSVHVI